MKLERLNDNQIKITLAPVDFDEFDVTVVDLLTDRNGKAKAFFETLMSMAREDLDFEADGAPIVVEAMQTGKDSLVLMVTRVDDNVENDPKLAHIKNMRGGFDEQSAEEYEDDSQENFQYNNIEKPAPDTSAKKPGADTLPNIPLKSADAGKPVVPAYAVCMFDSLEPLIKVAKMAESYYESDNSLYKSPENGKYYLVYTRNWNSEEQFLILMNQLREFGDPNTIIYASKYYIEEHYELIIEDDALQTLADI